MQTDGYTVFNGPLKHGSKGNDAGKKLQKAGQDAEIIRKNQHSNKQTLDGRHVAKVLNAQQDRLPPTIPQELRISIAQARNAKGWTQEELGKQCQIPKHEINSWEAGKSIPTGQQIVTMEGVLGVKLPRPPKH